MKNAAQEIESTDTAEIQNLYYDIPLEGEALEEEEFFDPDDSGLNYSQAEYEEERREMKSVSLFGILVSVLLNPVEGWKTLRRGSVKPERVERELLLPLAGFASLSCLATLFFDKRLSFQDALVDGVDTFVSIFFGYFVILILLKLIIPGGEGKPSYSGFCKSFTAVALSTTCLFTAVINLLPMLWAVLIFLPLWTVYSVCRGARFFRFPANRQIRYTGILCLLIVGTPELIKWFLSGIIP